MRDCVGQAVHIIEQEGKKKKRMALRIYSVCSELVSRRYLLLAF